MASPKKANCALFVPRIKEIKREEMEEEKREERERMKGGDATSSPMYSAGLLVH